MSSRSNQSRGKHHSFPYFSRIHIARFASVRKLQELFADAIQTNHILRGTKFGDIITADQKILNEQGESRNNQRNVIVVQKLATQWIQSYRSKTKTSQETMGNLRKFLGPEEKQKVKNTDNSWDFGKDWEDLRWNRCVSTLLVDCQEINFPTSEMTSLNKEEKYCAVQDDVCHESQLRFDFQSLLCC